ncbi:MAG: phage portal protein [Rhodobacter sp.]|nr:phage portal protein [Rhodobacter sp.]
MGLLSRLLGRTAPAPTAVRRFDGAAAGRRATGMGTFGRINPEIATAGPRLRSRAAYLSVNNPWIANAVGNWTGALIGPGIQPTAKHPDPDVRKALNRYFQDWASQADIEGRTDFWGLQAIAADSMVKAGEAVVLLVRTADGPRLRVIASELLDDAKTVELADGNSIYNGVEVDSDGRRVAYWILPEKPNSVWTTYAPSVRVSADQVLHVFKPVCPGQLRGITWLAAVVLAASELDQLMDAHLVGAKLAAMAAGFIVDLNGTGGSGFDQTIENWESGGLHRLGPGEDIKFNSPAQLQQIDAFLKMNLRQLAAGLGLPDHLLSGDLTGANYSSLRAGLLPFRQRVEQIQYGVLVPQLLAPVWRAVILHGILSGEIPAADFESNPAAYLTAEWLPPKPMQVDPLKDTNATVAELEAGLTSRRKAVAERGWVLEDLDSEIAAERNPNNGA